MLQYSSRVANRKLYASILSTLWFNSRVSPTPLHIFNLVIIALYRQIHDNSVHLWITALVYLDLALGCMHAQCVHGLYPTRLLCPWNFPDKNTGLGCHSSGDLLDPGIEPWPPALAGRFLTIWATYLLTYTGFPSGSAVKNLLSMQEMWVWSQG